MGEVIEYVDPTILKADPNQPRQEFDEKEIDQLAKTFDAQEIINPLEVDENNFIILGERRWRAAIKKSLEKVPVRRKTGLSHKGRLERQLIDDAQRKNLSPQERVWAYATAIVNINTNGNYTIDQIKEMYENDFVRLTNFIVEDEEKKARHIQHGQSQLARTIGVNQSTISGYMSFFDVGKKLQEAFMDNKIEYTYLDAVTRILDPKEQARIEQILLEDLSKLREERTFTAPIRLREYATHFNNKLEELAEARAKEIREPSEEAIEKEAKKRAKKRLSIREKAITSLAQVMKKIRKATLDIDVSNYEERFQQIQAKIGTDDEVAWDEAKRLKKDLDKAIRAKKMEREITKSAIEAARKELMEDPEFIKEVRETQNLAMEKEDEIKSKEIVDDMVKDFLPAIEKAYANLPKERKDDPERNRLVLNMLLKNLNEGLLFCPVCGQHMFECNACHTSLKTMKEEAKI